jgi:hypothetical protein
MRLSPLICLMTVLSHSSMAGLAHLYTVTNSNDSGAGSLRDAITQANTDSGDSLITFAIPGSGELVIQPATPLPSVAGLTTIDATGQLNADLSPRVALDGANAGASAIGLELTGGSSSILGLEVRDWGGGCIVIRGANCQVLGCHILAGGVTLARNGIAVRSALNTHVGGPGAGQRNVIGHTIGNGILVTGNSEGTVIRGNSIGTDWTGTAADRCFRGITVEMTATNTTIGGGNPGEGNVISGNTIVGCDLAGGCTVRGNIVGLAADGVTPVPNGNGIHTEGGVACSIGGTSQLAAGLSPSLGEGNIVAANVAVQISSFTDDTVIQGNLVGLAADGRLAGGGQLAGIEIQNASGNMVGGATRDLRNVVVGSGDGVLIGGSGGGNSVVAGNLIGVNLSAEVIGNTLHGILDADSSFNVIGGDTFDLGNVIAGSGLAGVAVTGTANNVKISANSIFANRGLGIDLGDDGVTANDVSQDADSGPNLLQNFPIITEAEFDGATPHVSGSLHSQVATLYTIQLFLDVAPHPSGHGEGQIFVTSLQVLTDTAGAASWEVDLAESPAGERYVTALAIGPAQNTSEFSPSLQAPGRDPSPEELIQALLGLIPMLPDYERNGDDPFDAADLVTLVNVNNAPHN